MEKEIEIYNYIKENYYYKDVIIRALIDGINDENMRLKESKSKVEAGLVIVCDNLNLKKLSKNYLSVILEALQNCTFFKMNSFIEKLTKKEK